MLRFVNYDIQLNLKARQSEILTDFQQKVQFNPFREIYVGLEMLSDSETPFDFLVDKFSELMSMLELDMKTGWAWGAADCVRLKLGKY